MDDTEQRKPYWRETKLLMLACLVTPCAMLMGLPYWVGLAGTGSIAGLPVGYLIAVHGVVIAVIAAVARFVLVQERIDRWHGTHEDG